MCSGGGVDHDHISQTFFVRRLACLCLSVVPVLRVETMHLHLDHHLVRRVPVRVALVGAHLVAEILLVEAHDLVVRVREVLVEVVRVQVGRVLEGTFVTVSGAPVVGK
jgi:hypothetical protein